MSWPEGGLPHGEHPYDYGYVEEDPDEWEDDREPCTCTIACIPQGLTENQVCRQR